MLHSPQAKPALIATANQAIPWRTFLDESKGKIEKAAKTPTPKPAKTPTPAAVAKPASKKLKNAAKAAGKAPPVAAKAPPVAAKAAPAKKPAAAPEKQRKAPAEKAVKLPTCKKRHVLQMGAFAPSGWECDGT